jgi:hypothetical protein
LMQWQGLVRHLMVKVKYMSNLQFRMVAGDI